MKLHLILLALAALLLAHACATNKPAREEVNGVPLAAPKAVTPKAGHSSRHDGPASSRATRSRHTEPPSRLDRLDWHALALCESSDNPRAVSASGRYRGLYQFDRETWESVGGTGDPAQASREEQTHRALVLFTRRGPQPWPRCGDRL